MSRLPQGKKMIVISSPSGAGKTTIVHHLLKTHPELAFSVSATTRPKRDGEEDGKDYYFYSPEAFRQAIQKADFVEWEEVYKGRYYGTLKSEMERIWQQGKQIIFDIDVKGALSIKKLYKDRAMTIFIKAPSLEALRQRLLNRGSEDNRSLEERIDRARLELTYEDKFDRVVLNDDLKQAIRETDETVKKFLLN